MSPEFASLSDDDLSAIEARLAAASPGPWKAFVEGRDHHGGSSIIATGYGVERGADIELVGATKADYDFIAHARRDVEILLNQVKRTSKRD